MIKILSWNILHGGGRRMDAILDAIAGHKPDILTLQEVRWRSRNPDAREFTWISAKRRNGFRYDHALATPALDKRISEHRLDVKSA